MSYERENIKAMLGYVSGEQPDDANTIKLNTNENPYPASPEVDRVIDTFKASDLRRYPPPMTDQFRSLAAELHQLDKDNIIATRGGDELLRLVITTFVAPGETIAMSEPTYSLYPVLAQIQDCPVFKVPLNQDWSLSSSFIDEVNLSGAKLTFVVNPHAPSGYLLDIDAVRKLASELNSLVLIDEAYVDFIDPEHEYDCLPLIKEFNNLIFLRTLSKGYSLAGLRFGYGIGHSELISPMLKKTRDSYNLDLFSQQIATAALKDQAYAKASWQKVRQERTRLKTQLAQSGLTSAPSEANFLLVTVEPKIKISAEQIYLALKEKHILIRFFDAAGLNDKLRISVGTPEENNLLLLALDQIIAKGV